MSSTIARRIAVAGLVSIAAVRLEAWGPEGHRIVGRSAALALPEEMPDFFRDAPRLEELNPEPDRWYQPEEAALFRSLAAGAGPDHYLDFEIVPPGALDAADRHSYSRLVDGAGIDPARAGFLPYRILELFQAIRIGFRRWRREHDPGRRRWIEERILDDAGLLGHYVADLANPLHVTEHFDGFVGENPEGLTARTKEAWCGIHYRFEEEFVRSRIGAATTLEAEGPAGVVVDPRAAVRDWILRSNSLVLPLYRLDRSVRFGEECVAESNRLFAEARLRDGVTRLRDLWWTAWITSAPEPAPNR